MTRTFVLNRIEDASGVSGTGVVAEGVVFSDGKCAVRWIVGEHRCTSTWDSLNDIEKVHGHGGMTVIVFHDEQNKADPAGFDW